MSEKFSDKTLAVTGASGQLGRGVVEYLMQRGAKKIVAVTRKPDAIADLAARGVDVRQGDFDDVSSLDAAFQGVDRLLLVSTDLIDANGSRAAQQTSAIDAAERAGVSHLIYTSFISPYPHATALIENDHFWTEVRLLSGRTDWTLLRNNIYADMLIGDAERAIASGALLHAAGDGRRGYVTRDDCAAAAAGALLTAEGKAIYAVTGPEAVTLDDVAAIIARIAGRPIAARNLPADALVAGMVEHGVPAPIAGAYVRLDTDTAEGRLAVVTDAVRQLAGRAPTSVADFLSQNISALAA